MGAQHLPGEEVWLIGEHRSTGERKYYLSNLPADTPLKHLAAAIKARWVCEQAHQQLKEELGLDHFEGRSWTGLHRHALMTMIAYAFLQSRRLKQATREKKNPGPATTAKPASDPAAILANSNGRRQRDARIAAAWLISLKICQSSASPSVDHDERFDQSGLLGCPSRDVVNRAGQVGAMGDQTIDRDFAAADSGNNVLEILELVALRLPKRVISLRWKSGSMKVIVSLITLTRT